MHVSVLLLAGGEGTRFQPISTPECPKQFLPLTHPEQSLLQQTWDRATTIAKPKDIWIATHKRYVSLVQQALPWAQVENIIGETEKKNTAPAIALTSWLLAARQKETILVVLPSDHFIDEPGAFQKTIQQAIAAAREHNGILTLGIPPREASTQYGYIQQGKKIDDTYDAYQVRCFTEKPVRHRAEKFIAEGGYYWNSGMFIFPVGLMKEEIKRCAPPIARALATLKGKKLTEEFLQWYCNVVPTISIDYAVMEKTDRAVVIPAPFFWSDVGSWEGLAELSQKKAIVIPDAIRETMQAQIQQNQT